MSAEAIWYASYDESGNRPQCDRVGWLPWQQKIGLEADLAMAVHRGLAQWRDASTKAGRYWFWPDQCGTYVWPPGKGNKNTGWWIIPFRTERAARRIIEYAFERAARKRDIAPSRWHPRWRPTYFDARGPVTIELLRLQRAAMRRREQVLRRWCQQTASVALHWCAFAAAGIVCSFNFGPLQRPEREKPLEQIVLPPDPWRAYRGRDPYRRPRLDIKHNISHMWAARNRRLHIIEHYGRRGNKQTEHHWTRRPPPVGDDHISMECWASWDRARRRRPTGDPAPQTRPAMRLPRSRKTISLDDAALGGLPDDQQPILSQMIDDIRAGLSRGEAVRRAQKAGASTGSITAVMGISRQRVHQLSRQTED